VSVGCGVGFRGREAGRVVWSLCSCALIAVGQTMPTAGPRASHRRCDPWLSPVRGGHVQGGGEHLVRGGRSRGRPRLGGRPPRRGGDPHHSITLCGYGSCPYPNLRG